MTTFQPAALPEPMGWYVVNNIGMATLCKDESEAQLLAEDCDMVYPSQAPHRAVQLIALAALQSQPAAAGVSDAEIRHDANLPFVEDEQGAEWVTLSPAMFARAVRRVLALRPQSESEQEKELRRSLAEAQATISERNAEIIELQKRIRRSPQAVVAKAPVPMTDENGPPTEPGLYAWVGVGNGALVVVNKRPSEHAPGGELNGHVINSTKFYDGCPVKDWGQEGQWVLLKRHGITAPAGGEG